MSVIKAEDSVQAENDWITTGMSKLDAILGGGVPTKRITEISGPFGVGKTTLALTIAGQAQKQGYTILWCDQEWAWEPKYATLLGVDVKKTFLIQERLAETALDDIEEFANKHKKVLIILDAVGALLPRQEAEKGSGEKVIGGQAKLIATFCRKIVPMLAINNNALIVLNHEFIDLLSGRLMTSGGAKLAYHKSIWLKLRKANKKIMQSDQQIGDITIAEVRKHKLAGTQRQEAELHLLFGKGFSVEQDKMQQLLEEGRLVKKGQTYHLDGVKVAVGQAKMREYLKEHPEI